MDTALLATALLLGLSGAGHCLGMCGGIAAALQLGGASGWPITLSYHSGRLISYALAGAILGQLAGLGSGAAWTMGLRLLAGALMIAMGLYIADWWRGLSVLERAGGRLFAPVQTLAGRLLPLRHSYQGFTLGLCWGLMPCGLIYSSLAWAATTGDGLSAALLMLVFGAGTLPAMLAVSVGADRLQAFLRRRQLKVFIALMLIFSGLWTLYAAQQHAGHHANDPASTQLHDGHH